MPLYKLFSLYGGVNLKNKKNNNELIKRYNKKIIIFLVIGIGIILGAYIIISNEYGKFLNEKSKAISKFDLKINSINDYKEILNRSENIYINDDEKNTIEDLKQKIIHHASEGITEEFKEHVDNFKLLVDEISKSNEKELKELFSETNNINKDYFSKEEIEKIDTYIDLYNESYNEEYYKNAKEVLGDLDNYLQEVKKIANTRKLKEIYDKNDNENPDTREPKYVNGILIVNKEYGLPANYDPGENKEAKDAFNRMKADASKEDIYLNAFSIYRNYSTQNRLYKDYVASYGKEATDTFSARAGFSEHQTGLALDIGGKDSSLWGEPEFNNTKEAKWLKENSYKYGFILRYPEGKEWKTGYMYESWHYRYLGVEHSKNFNNNNLTLEEYLDL